MPTKLSSSLPKADDDNGLDTVEDRLARGQYVHAVVLLDAKTVAHDVDTGNQTVTARVVRLEPATAGPMSDMLAEVLDGARESRTGKTPLPLEVAGP